MLQEKNTSVLDGLAMNKACSIHDLRNMIGAALGSVQLMKSFLTDNPTSVKLYENAVLSLKHMQDFVTTLEPDSVNDMKVSGQSPTDVIHAKTADSNELNDHHGLFFAAIEMTRMPMIVTDPHQPDNPIIFANQAFMNTSGYQQDELLGKNCRFLQGDATDAATVTAIRQAIQNKTDVSVEIQNYRKDGTMFWNALFISPIFSAKGELLYFFGSQLDVTRRREAENSLRKAQKLEAIGQLTGGIAHDFNNLLQVMLGNLQLAKVSVEQPARIIRHLESASQAAERAKVLTQQLLAFSRQQPLEARVVNFNRVLDDLREILSKTLGSHIEIRWDLDNNLHNSKVDVVQLELAIINILVNSRDAMPQGGKVVVRTCNRIISASQAKNETIKTGQFSVIQITDTGVGIEKDILNRVTDPFFTTKEVGKGTGLGLAQVSGFVQQSGGSIDIESVVGKGTSISLYFPVNYNTEDSPRIASDQLPPQGKGEKILLVEDNPQVQELATIILEQEGYQVIIAENAHKALDCFNFHPDIAMLFTDIVMPGEMNGIQLAKKLRAENSHLAVLVTTGFAEDTHGHANAMEFEVIYKPYVPQDLANKIRNVLNRGMDHGT